jgi:hypothetical protein
VIDSEDSRRTQSADRTMVEQVCFARFQRMSDFKGKVEKFFKKFGKGLTDSFDGL